MNQRKTNANNHHQVALDDIVALMKKHAPNVSAIEMLAIASNLVGKIAAMQDQTTMTKEIIMATISANIEQGNLEAANALRNSTPAGHA